MYRPPPLAVVQERMVAYTQAGPRQMLMDLSGDPKANNIEHGNHPPSGALRKEDPAKLVLVLNRKRSHA